MMTVARTDDVGHRGAEIAHPIMLKTMCRRLP
jgi:hypothetical protein